MVLTVDQYREMTQNRSTPPTDVDITLALARYTALIEGFCGRSFSYQTCCETHYNVGLGPIGLNVYPVGEVTGITVKGESKDLSQYQIHKSAGLIYHEGSLYAQDVRVQYVGGFAEAPYEVKVALSTLVSAYLSGEHGGVETLQSGRKEVVQGVGSIDYGGSQQQTAAFGSPYAELGPYVSILEKFRVPAMA